MNGAPGSRSHASTPAKAPNGTAANDSVAATRTVRWSLAIVHRATISASSRDLPIPLPPASTAPPVSVDDEGQLLLPADERPVPLAGSRAHAGRIEAPDPACFGPYARSPGEMGPRGTHDAA